MQVEQWTHGIAYWAPIVGPWQSSTRAELAGMTLAMNLLVPLSLGIDNKAVVDKGTLLIEKAREMGRDKLLNTSKPLKKPW